MSYIVTLLHCSIVPLLHCYICSRRLLDADAAVFHLAAVAFEADGTGGGNFHGRLQYFAVAHAVRRSVFNDHLDFIPIASAIVLKLLVRAGEQVVAALKLPATHKDAAVGVGRGAEF